MNNIKAIATKTPYQKRDNIATDGIEITPIRISAKVAHTSGIYGSDDSILFYCWDMAGQDVYYNTHQFFLTDK